MNTRHWVDLINCEVAEHFDSKNKKRYVNTRKRKKDATKQIKKVINRELI